MDKKNKKHKIHLWLILALKIMNDFITFLSDLKYLLIVH